MLIKILYTATMMLPFSLGLFLAGDMTDRGWMAKSGLCLFVASLVINLVSLMRIIWSM